MGRQIFEPIAVGGLKLKNRLVRSATWEGIAALNGHIDEATYRIYDELARGGVGLVITGFTSVAGNDRYFGGMMRLHDDALVPQYAKLVDAIHAQDVPVLAQLALGGFYREDGRQVEPDGMTIEEIHQVERWFVEAAVRAKTAGFDGVQVHVAHFFFLSRFVSPAVNHRRDEYGGSTENRARIVLNIVRGIREQAPGLHMCAKVNSNDFTPGGLGGDEALELCKLLSDAGLDSIEVSGNGTSVAGVRAGARRGLLRAFREAACGRDRRTRHVGGWFAEQRGHAACAR